MANNPLNVRYSDANDWVGQIGNDRGFVDFSDDSFSYRAADMLLGNYGSVKGARTLRDTISIYAPPNENDTDNYVNFVSSRLNINPDAPIDLDDPNLRTILLSAMVKMESGFDITPGQVAQKLKMASTQTPADDLRAVFDSVFNLCG